MRRIALMLFLAVTAITLSIGLADAGTYTVKWVNVTSINDTLNLNFVSTVSNATLTLSSTAKVDVFPLAAATTEPAQYCIKISGNWINITNSTGYLKASFYDSNFWKYVNATGADIRITNQSSQLYFWIQDFNATAKTATIWVNLTAGSTELDICYGYLNALPSTYNNASRTFLFFDDFTKGLVGTWVQITGTWVDDATGLYVSTTYASAPGNVIIYTGKNFTAGTYITYLYGILGSNDVGVVINAQGTTATAKLDLATADKYHEEGLVNEWDGSAWETGATAAMSLSTGDKVIVKAWQKGNVTYSYIKDLTNGSTASISRVVSLTQGYIGVHNAIIASSTSVFKLMFVASLADPAVFETPYQTQQNITVTVTVGTFTITTNASTIAIPLTAFSSTTHVVITPIGSARFNATLTFNYAYSSTTTVIDTGTVIEKNFTVNTSGLTVPLTLNVTFPLRTKAYKLFVSVSPTTTVTNTTTNTSVITSYILQNNTTYTIDEKIGYLIAKFTGKDELTGSTLSSITVNYTSSSGWKSVSGPTVSIYGTDLPLHQTETIIEFSAAGYSSRHYILNCTKLNQSITLYLLADSASTMITYTITTGTAVLSHAKVIIEKNIGLKSVIIDSQYSDSSGVVSVPLHAFDIYTIIASKPGYGSITSTITISQSQYTIRLSSANLAIPKSSRAVITIEPTSSILPAGNNTITVTLNPNGQEITSATITVKVNGSTVATISKSAITQTETVSFPVSLNESSKVSVLVECTQNGETFTVEKNYTVPQNTGVWAALMLLNNQLSQTKYGKTIGLLIAAFIALAVAATLAATTNTTARGLGFVALAVFSIVAIPLNAISIPVLSVIWIAVIATWIIWRWI